MKVQILDDGVFLVDENGNINAHSGNKEVRIDFGDLYYLKKLYGVY